MNPHNTLEKMRAMRLKTMAELYQQSLASNLYEELSLDEVMATLIDAEWEDRQQWKIAGLIKRAGFRQQASATDIDYHPDRDRQKLARAGDRPPGVPDAAKNPLLCYRPVF